MHVLPSTFLARADAADVRAALMSIPKNSTNTQDRYLLKRLTLAFNLFGRPRRRPHLVDVYVSRLFD
jgi:hypothetical protein